MLAHIRKLIESKSTKICVAADVKDLQTLYKLIEDVGEHICILKIHSDLIYGFFDDLNQTIKILKELQFKYNFLIWEDAKFADIGSVMKRKIDFVKQWADLVSIHPIAGHQSTKLHIGIILIGEMSSEGHLFSEDYQKKVVEIGNQNQNVVGFVCQHKMSHDLLNITPGISLSMTKDNKGQQYSNPKDRAFADIFVIGRSIYNSKSPKEEILKYKKLIDSL